MSNDETIAQAYGRDAARSVESIAAELETLAARLRLYKPALTRAGGEGGRVAADIVNEYTQGVGTNGTRLYNLVTTAADSDRHFAAEQAASKS